MSVRIQHHVRTVARYALGDRGRALVRKVELANGLRPRINHHATGTMTYPEGRKAAVTIVADLELGWAWRYARCPNPLALAYQKSANGRRNVAAVLDLCDAYNVPISWAIVGHLFLDGCQRTGGLAHAELPRVRYFTNERWQYQTGDWFDCDPGLTGDDNGQWPVWYAPDLVRAILNRTTRHEIGSHSFSHIPFEHAACPEEVATSELRLCREIAAGWGLELRSFVYPGNFQGHRSCLLAAGFTSYRAVGRWELDLPRRDAYGLWAVPAGLCLDRAYRCWTPDEHFESVRRYIDAAIDTGLPCSLWFHPEEDPAEVDALFPRLFAYLEGRKSDVWLTTMTGLTRWLDGCTAQPVAGPSGAPRA